MLPGADEPLPDGVTLVSGTAPGVDIIHHYNAAWNEEPSFRSLLADTDTPWVTTCHSDPSAWGMDGQEFPHNWIFVSPALARTCGSSRYVLNGIDPAPFRYSGTKGEHFVFMANFRPGYDKGLDLAMELSGILGFHLVVAGASKDAYTIRRTLEKCQRAGANYVGDVRGREKADLLAAAKALLFPTKTNEAFGLVMAEALVSGTPVICSDKGACPEIISNDVGFVCRDLRDYVDAVSAVEEISPSACRLKAFRDFHYVRMALDYVAEYEEELTRAGRRIPARRKAGSFANAVDSNGPAGCL